MKCNEAQDLLSAWYDGELSEEMAAGVQRHVAGCARCEEEMRAYRSLSSLAAGLPDPEPPAAIWEQLEASLDARPPALVEPVSTDRRMSADRRRSLTRWLALAASVLIAVGVGWWGLGHGQGGHHEMAMVFNRYLEQFETSPDAAQQMLVSMYQGQAVAPDQAIQLVGYRPAAANPLPTGYDAQGTYVLKMPCCTCVQTVCRRQDGTTVAIFEHDDKNEEWLEGRPMEMAECDGTQCQLCKVKSRLAARWQRGSRHITMVGVQDAEEVSTLIAWLDQNSPGESS